MVSKSDKIKYQKVLGRRNYTKVVLETLNELSVKNVKGNPYNANDVRKVMGGFEENHAIETAILITYKNKQKAQEELDNEKKEAFKITKPKAATFG